MATTNHEHPQPVFGVGDTVALRRRSDAVGTVTAVRGLTSLCRATSAWATPWHGRLPPARIASPPPRIRSAAGTSVADPLRRQVAAVTSPVTLRVLDGGEAVPELGGAGYSVGGFRPLMT